MRDGAPLAYTGREVFGRIGYILDGPIYGLAEGWVVFTVTDQIRSIAT